MVESGDLKNATYDVVPLRLAIRAMRDNGYKNAAYAIAELVDNSVQAGASLVEIVCKEEEELIKQRRRTRVREIAVIDNGIGMNVETLRRALQFGVGERLTDRSGIGRFGMGLPNSSISQARRVDVWTWQGGSSAKAIHTHLDLDEIENDEMKEIPFPVERSIPSEWTRVSRSVARATSGTLVVWSKLDKCDWRTAHAIFRNSEYTIGRIYRRFLEHDHVRIRMAAFSESSTTPHFEEFAKPNDPMYLMSGTSCPEPWDQVPMFEPYGEPDVVPVRVGESEFEVTIRFSVAKKQARELPQAGGEPWGKHAANNIGVSVVRADRELELQSGWSIGYDPRERWWGVEINFPAALDEVFGVPNNKQSAPGLVEFAGATLDQIAKKEGYESAGELEESWTQDDDPRLVLIKVKKVVERNLANIRKTLKAQAERSTGKRRHEDPTSAEYRGTIATENRKEEGHRGSSDQDEQLPDETKRIQLADDLQRQGLDRQEAESRAISIVGDRTKFEFYEVDLTTAELFNVRTRAGAILIGLNTNHPGYEHLVALLKDEPDSSDPEELRSRLRNSYEGLKLLLEAWARYEDELDDGIPKERAQTARLEWGRVARDFFR